MVTMYFTIHKNPNIIPIISITFNIIKYNVVPEKARHQIHAY